MDETSVKNPVCGHDCAWKRRFEQLAGFLAREYMVEKRMGAGTRRPRLYAFADAYAYASGIAGAAGVELPDLEE